MKGSLPPDGIPPSDDPHDRTAAPEPLPAAPEATLEAQVLWELDEYFRRRREIRRKHPRRVRMLLLEPQG